MSSPLLFEQHPVFLMQNTPFNEGILDGFPATQSYEPSASPRPWQYEAADGRYNPAHFLNQPVPSPQARTQPHRRALSNSTLASFTSNNSPYLQSQNLPHATTSAVYDNFDYYNSYEYSSLKTLPTPSRTPTNDPGVERSVQPPSSDPTSAKNHHLAPGMMNGHAWNANLAYSSQNPAHYHQNLPHTPRTANGDERDEQHASGFGGWEPDQSLFPGPMQRYEGEVYTSAPMQSAPALAMRHQGAQQMMVPYPSIINQRLQEARSSPGGSLDRQASPFRHGSPFAAPGATPVSSTGSGRGRRQVKEPDNVYQQDETQQKTISPKDAVFDYRPEAHDDSAPPSLFPETSNMSERSFDEQQPYGQSVNERRTHRARYPMPSNYSFVPPPMPAAGSKASYPGDYKFSQPGLGNDEQPDYPAHLISMETSKSEPDASQSHDEGELEKPAGATADAGTYTCTYHGCTQRFRSPADLQRHKREGHRSGAQGHGGSAAGRSDSPGAAAAAYKNSQAGPHRCDRINPSTGKPCSTIFSRPYDLTRHEDTIHNAQKKKVRCQLCAEEKTFSRSDALTRHMRVVHPEVDFPGKHRRRGAGAI